MIRPKIKISEKGKDEWNRFRKEMGKVKGSHVTIGIHEGAGEYPDGVSVVQVGLWNEFGTETSPARSFIRSTIDEHMGDINRWRVELVKQVLAGKITVDKALETIGFRLRELVKNKINSNVPPPNAPSTIAAKRHAGVAPRTLVETTLLLRSIEYRVVINE